MISKTKLLNIINGREKTAGAALVRAGLWCATPLYALAVFFRNRKYDNASNAVTRVGVPVISIGNLTTGGTGKTPMVIWVCRKLRAIDRRVAVISRGYAAERSDAGTRAPNDEAMEMGHRLPDVPQLQDPDRIKSANIAIDELETECLVLDDGFQHRKLHRDLDVVLVDATEPFGYGHLLPRGLMREPKRNLARADVIIVTRCNQVDSVKVDAIVQTIRQIVGDQILIGKAKTVPTNWLQYGGQVFAINELADEAVFACCAIGNPKSFLDIAARAGANITGSLIFDDHHQFSRDDCAQIAAQAKRAGAKRIICTHKDLVKIAVNEIDGLPVFALQADVVFLEGEDAFEAQLKRTAVQTQDSV